STPLITAMPSSCAGTLAKEPLKEPTAVRAALAMTIEGLDMAFLLEVFAEQCQRPGTLSIATARLGRERPPRCRGPPARRQCCNARIPAAWLFLLHCTPSRKKFRADRRSAQNECMSRRLSLRLPWRLGVGARRSPPAARCQEEADGKE